ncbi:MAG: CoA transferase [Alicycliphilus denitrificans]|nr:CoA transferase [Alicycliphilus denitrificans]
MAGALSGIFVLDLTRILAGPWCTQMLADLGADVIKVERPRAGDDTRHWGPPWLPAADGERADSTYYTAANRNKKSISVDIASKEGQALVRELALRADVVVENYKVGDLARYGLDYASLRAINPRLVYCSITGYGQDGPYADRPGYDFVFQGEGGLMSVTGEADDKPGGGPQKVGVAVTDLMTGMYASVAILAALNHRHASGTGQYIDIALLDCIAAMGANHAATHLLTGSVPRRYGNAHAVMVPYQVFRTADGHIIVAAGNDAQWQRFCQAIERPDLGADARFATAPGRITHRLVLIPDMERTMLTQSSDYWLERLSAHDVPNGRINDYRQVFEHPQLVHRGMRVDIPTDDGGSMASVANPIRFSETPIGYRAAPPRLGQHTSQVLGDLLGKTPEELVALQHKGVI